MTPEGKVKHRVKALLKEYHAYFHMPVQTGYGAPSLDFNCCHAGRYFSIETKAPGKKLTLRQEFTKSEIEAAGGKVFVIEDNVGIDELWLWLQTHS